jgi:glutamate-1-semialdehyde 2,1-aminomutase/spore coat polysaccharide biosynthesis protein SpsF
MTQAVTQNFCPSPKSKRDFKKSANLIPCGVQTLSKMPNKFVEGVYPIYLEWGKGAYVGDHTSRFIDYPLGLGAILLGHAYPEVVKAVQIRLADGNLFICPSILETQLAEKLKELIPCAEMSRFLKTGSEATSAAVKIARSFTNREHIAICGYHGWHDWFTVSTPKNKGIPKVYGNFVHKFEFNNLQSLKDITDKYKLAAVIMEPCIFDEPKDRFLDKVKDLVHENGGLLIFDEVVTGFRTLFYSAQKYFQVTPDLATFGKDMANGIPISVVCGKKKYMKELEGDCFVSSTFGGDLLGIVGALETIKVLEDNPVLEDIWYHGNYLKDGYNEIAQGLDVESECKGYPNRTFFTFPTGVHKSLFWQECIRRGVFFGWANFISYSHREREILYTLDVVQEALKVVKANWKKPLKALKGNPAAEVFRLVAEKK